MAAQHLARRGHFEALRDRLLGFASRNRFWHKEPGMYLHDADWQPKIFQAEAQLNEEQAPRVPWRDAKMAKRSSGERTCTGRARKLSSPRARPGPPKSAQTSRVQDV